jgi:HPt (histidine-containing phosphotransfer) domain-containing protein
VPAAAAAGGFDRAAALERLGGDEELLAVALASFREHAPRVLRSAADALAAGQPGDLARHLHSLAGSSSMVGGAALEQAARALQARTEAGELQEVQARLPELQRALEAFIAASGP